MLTSLSACRHPGRSMLFARRRIPGILSLPAGHLWRVACNHQGWRSCTHDNEKEPEKENVHTSCRCSVPDREEYCGAACRHAGSRGVEISCQCDHVACSLMIRPFGAGSANPQGLKGLLSKPAPGVLKTLVALGHTCSLVLG